MAQVHLRKVIYAPINSHLHLRWQWSMVTPQKFNTDIAKTSAREITHGELFDEQQVDVGGRDGHQQETLTANIASSHSAILDDARQTETADSHNFQMVEQSLEDDLKFDVRDLEDPNRSLDCSNARQQSFRRR